MTTKRKFVWLALFSTLLMLQGCDKKKKAGLPPKTQAPTIALTLPSELPPVQETV